MNLRAFRDAGEHAAKVRITIYALSGKSSIDPKSWNLSLTVGNVTHIYTPMFLVSSQGCLGYTTGLSQDAMRFCGWRPYPTTKIVSFEDKVAFKETLANANIPAPSYKADNHTRIQNVIVKRRKGSFSLGILGPFRTSTQHTLREDEFFESFIQGTNVKVWFLNEHPVLLKRREHPCVIGDGTSTLTTLISQKVCLHGKALEALPQYYMIKQVLDYLGLNTSDVVEKDIIQPFDFRYQPDYDVILNETDILVTELSESQQEQLRHIGKTCFEKIQQEQINLLCYSVDAVETSDGTFWILEANSNSMIHPEVYDLMIRTHFGQIT